MNDAKSGTSVRKSRLGKALSFLAVLAIALSSTGSLANASQPTLPADWDVNAVEKPTVVQELDGYKMWYDGLDRNDQRQVGLATSLDGTSWVKYADNPVLAGGQDAWDSSGEHAPFVIKDGDLYKMWYEGSDGSVRQLGYATSPDGVTWTKYEGNPVVHAGPEDYDNVAAAHGTVLYEDGLYKLWYHAIGDQGILIAYATSPNGIDWTKMGPVLMPDPATWDADALWGPSVLKVGETYWMWYTGRGPDYPVSIGVATSPDGANWTRVGDGPVISDFANGNYFGDPQVILDGETYKMWFNNYGDHKIYYAESADGLTWDSYAPVLSQGIWNPLQGWHDGAEGSVDANSCTAFGWAVDPDNRDADASVRIFSDGVQIAEITASDYGEDMERENLCPNGTCRFTVNLWGIISPDVEHQITVQAYDPGTDKWWNLEGTPKTVTCVTPSPHFTVFPEWEWFDALDWPSEATVSITVQDKPECDTSRVSTGSFFNGGFPEGCDVQIGDTVTFSDGVTTRQHVVQNLGVTSVSSAADTVTGTANEGAQLHVWAHDYGDSQLHLTASAEGTWLTEFASIGVDILPGMCGRSEIRDEVGNATAVDWCAQNPFLIAFPENDAVEAWEWPDGSSVHLSIAPSDSEPPVYEADGIMAPTTWGDTRTYFRFEFGDQYDLKPGDVVTLSGSDSTRIHTVRNLSVNAVDVFADTVAGAADGGAEVQVWPHGFDQTATVRVTAGEDGSWLADLAALFDILPGTAGRSQIQDEAGNATAVDWQAYMNYDIYAYNPLTGQIQQITHLPDTSEFNPSWSPNGKKIAHEVTKQDGSQSIYITTVATGVSKPLTGAEGGNDAAWSPNSLRIMFDRNWAGDPSLYMVPEGGGRRTLVRHDAISADWAPNSKRIVFQQPSDGSIRTMPIPAGAGRETIVAPSGVNPVWSPDGKWIAYANEGDIWKIAVNANGVPSGSAIQLTTRPTNENHPAWSADSTTVAFHSGFNSDYDIWRVAAAGGDSTWLVGAPGLGDYSPTYAKNGPRIAYTGLSPDGQAPRLWVTAYTYDPGPWSEGEHSYHFGSGVAGDVPSADIYFNVSAGAPAYSGRVLLRTFAVKACVDGSIQEIDHEITPGQPTRFMMGWETQTEVTYSDALAFFNTLAPYASWDGGSPVQAVQQYVIPYNAEDWDSYECAYAAP